MLTAFKSPMGILCHCILSPPLLDSTISQHSVCVCLSSSLSERISHPLLLQLLAASLVIPPPAPLSLCLLSYISTSLSFFTSLFLPLPSLFFLPFRSFPVLYFPQFLVISLLHLFLFTFHVRPPPPSFPLFSYSLAEEKRRRRRIKCELNLPTVKR